MPYPYHFCFGVQITDKPNQPKLVQHFSPTRLEIYNDSHLHKHHAAMADSTSAETHFRVVISSDKFAKLHLIKRHRMVNELLNGELSREGGVHALQLKTMTPEEDQKQEEKKSKPRRCK